MSLSEASILSLVFVTRSTEYKGSTVRLLRERHPGAVPKSVLLYVRSKMSSKMLTNPLKSSERKVLLGVGSSEMSQVSLVMPWKGTSSAPASLFSQKAAMT